MKDSWVWEAVRHFNAAVLWLGVKLALLQMCVPSLTTCIMPPGVLMLHVKCTWCFQLLEEVCALGRDKSYVCQKTSGKMDQQQQNVFSSQGNNNSASSDDDDEDDDVASTHSGTTLKQTAPSFADPQYVNACCTVIPGTLSGYQSFRSKCSLQLVWTDHCNYVKL